MRYFDLHCDTITECERNGYRLYQNPLQLSLSNADVYRPWFQCFAVFIPDDLRGEKASAYFDKVLRYFRKELEDNQENLHQCVCAEDFERVEQENGCGAVLTVEGGAVLAGELSRISYLAECGVKALTLTWNGSNELGDGAMSKNPQGLTRFGRLAVRELEKNRIAIDVSHASDPLFYGVAEIAEKPLLATHSNSRKICPHPRNLTDEQFGIIRDSGGLVGLNFFTSFLREKGEATREDLWRHAEHFLSLGGEKTLAIGSDFDGAEMPKDLQKIQEVELLWETFFHHGCPEEVLDAIFYGNARRFFELL